MLDDVWDQFYICISNYKQIHHYSNKYICGANFLYIQTDDNIGSEEAIKKLLISCSKDLTDQFTLIYRVEFIRKESNNYVFRHRFYVPNKKMFCCGNNCANCTRFRK